LKLVNVEASTVHSFQGQEKDVIIIDTVDTNPMKPGFLLNDQSVFSTSDNLLNVAISRARYKVIIIADKKYILSQNGKKGLKKVLSGL